jgi:hypothetical protein
MFYGSESRDNAMPGSTFAITHHAFSAEQEGQQMETEATGAPQKHHYTANQQLVAVPA